MKQIYPKARLNYFLMGIFSIAFIFSPQISNAQNFSVPGFSGGDIPVSGGGGGGIQVSDLISNFFKDFSSIVGDIQTFLGEQGEGEVDTGDIGLPDFEEAKIVFAENQELNETSDLFGSQTGSTLANQDKLLHQYLRNVAQSFAENSALSLEGQQKISEQTDNVNETVDRSLELSNDSASQDVSQNILRNISGQLSLQQQIAAMTIFEMQEDKISRSLELQINSEALSEISKQTTRTERETIEANRNYLNSIYAVTIPGKRE